LGLIPNVVTDLGPNANDAMAPKRTVLSVIIFATEDDFMELLIAEL
jgi:hypothetical protein